MKENTAPTISLEDVSEDLVIEYLCAHPEFFQDHEDMLDNLYIPHPQQGNMVSLIERQVDRLRQQQVELQQAMKNTILIAKDNEKLFDSTKQFTISLLKAQNLTELLDIMQAGVKKDFKADLVRVGLVDKPEAINHETLFQYDSKLNTEVKDMLKGDKAVVKVQSMAVKNALFGAKAQKVGSCAVIPLGRQGSLGVLAIGSTNKRQFVKSMDTLFLDYIGQIIAEIVPKVR